MLLYYRVFQKNSPFADAMEVLRLSNPFDYFPSILSMQQWREQQDRDQRCGSYVTVSIYGGQVMSMVTDGGPVLRYIKNDGDFPMRTSA